MGTTTPAAAAIGEAIRLVLSPTPPVECISPYTSVLAVMSYHNPHTHVKGSEQRIKRAHLIKSHFVDEFLKYQRIVREKIHTPFPIIETNRAGDNLPHGIRITATNHSVFVHHALPFGHRLLIP